MHNVGMQFALDAAGCWDRFPRGEKGKKSLFQSESRRADPFRRWAWSQEDFSHFSISITFMDSKFRTRSELSASHELLTSRTTPLGPSVGARSENSFFWGRSGKALRYFEIVISEKFFEQRNLFVPAENSGGQAFQ